MDISNTSGLNVTSLSKINVLLGKNGSGKSTLLKVIENHLLASGLGEVNYVTPERGGALTYDSNVEQNVNTNQDYARNSKNQNQWGQFKNYSVAQYRQLEILSLREIEKDRVIRANLDFTFDNILDKINNLLSNVKITRSQKGDFEIILKATNEAINATKISSGESELISLAIECLKFEKTCDPTKSNFLLLDEPDVHLHPDLQANFILFLIELLRTNKFSIIIATHSTAILGALLGYTDARFAILKNGNQNVSFKIISDIYQNILPIFGAHPLSNLFNQSPIFLVEGEDDVRILQQTIRSSNGRLKIYPCSVDGVSHLRSYETSVLEIMSGIYDDAKAYSLRDRDDGNENIDDEPPLIRFKTSCRAVENLILCDETLQTFGTTWALLELEIEKWLVGFVGHAKSDIMQGFKASGYNRKAYDLKEIRNILVALTGSPKPWEIIVGQTIAKLVNGQINKDFSENCLCNFLGVKLSNIFRP